jgi:membrane-bound lytic murein transglycosylase D
MTSTIFRKTILTIVLLLGWVAPAAAQGEEGADAAAFVELLRTRRAALHFAASHGEGWGALWAPGAVYVAPAEVTGGQAPERLQAAIDGIWAAQEEEGWEMPFGLELRGQAPVEAFVRFWAGRGRATLARSLSRMGRYEETLRAVLREEGVPEDFIYLCLIESAFSPRALSPANARGLWQFIPATASHYGLRIDAEVDERLDPVRSTRAAARYLRDLRQQLGSWPLAMAGYNAGAGHVLTAMSRGNSNSYWSLARRGALYEGARNYVAKILAVALIGRNRERFDFDRVVPDEAWRFEVVEVPGGASLAQVAALAEATPEELRSLNPELLLGRTPSRRPVYALRVPPGGALKVAQGLSARPLAAEEGFLTYVTRLGESVEGAAARLGVREPVLRAASGLTAQERAPYGTPLRAPRAALEASLGQRAAR